MDIKLSARRIRKAARERFRKALRVESYYSRQLNALAKNVGAIIRAYAPYGEVTNIVELREALEAYSRALGPWALAVAKRMLADITSRDAKAWRAASREIGQHLHREINRAPVGALLRDALARQVSLITSLPLDAAQRVHELTVERLADSARAAELREEIMRSGEVARSQAQLIARTEVARTAAQLMQVRATAVGSEGYIWRTMLDENVRPAIGTPGFARLNTLAMGSHRKLEGTFHKWTEPPVASPKGERSHPGQIFNCRCFAEPVLPDVI